MTEVTNEYRSTLIFWDITPWRWRWYVSPEHRLTFSSVRTSDFTEIISQKEINYIARWLLWVEFWWGWRWRNGKHWRIVCIPPWSLSSYSNISRAGQSPSAQHFPGRDLALYHCLSLSLSAVAPTMACVYLPGSVAVRLATWKGRLRKRRMRG
jgi:hypothetical protein